MTKEELRLLKSGKPHELVDYCIKRRKSRWPEAEAYILRDLFWAAEYARYVLKERWPGAEPYIMRDPEAALFYALYVIEGPWPEAEPIIRRHAYSWYLYERHFGVRE